MEAETEGFPADYRQIPLNVNICRETIDKAIDNGFGKLRSFVWDGGGLTYDELARRVGEAAAGFAAGGITRGTPVVIRLPNCVEFAVTFLALTRIGALPVLQNSLLGAAEVEYVLDHAGARAAVTLDDIAAPLRDLSDRLDLGIFVARGAREGEAALESLGAGLPPPPCADTAADEPAFMVYTSGTTGRPKGIVHAHRWIIALGDSNRWRVPPLEGDVILGTGEWSFISALGHNVLFPLRNGVTGAILEGRALPERVLAAIEDLRVTVLYSVATVYRRILAIDGVEDRYDLSSLRGCNSTGEALEEETWREFRKRIGCDIWEHYGISEMQMVLGQGPRREIRPGSIGTPIPGTEIAVIDDDYNPVPDGEIGHFVIASDNPGFFLGYHRDVEKTREVVHDGWYHTGDLASRDEDGYFRIAGRSDDCFKSRGIFISPYEIENALCGHPAVAEACVVPRPDPEIGYSIRAVVVLREGNTGDAALGEAIRLFLRERMAPYKTPREVEFIAALPKSPVGKVLRRSLTD